MCVHNTVLSITRCKYTCDGSLLITSSWESDGGRIKLFDAYTGALVVSLSDDLGQTNDFDEYLSWYPRDVSCDSSCSAIATVSADGTVGVWDPWSNKSSYALIHSSDSPFFGVKVRTVLQYVLLQALLLCNFCRYITFCKHNKQNSCKDANYWC